MGATPGEKKQGVAQSVERTSINALPSASSRLWFLDQALVSRTTPSCARLGTGLSVIKLSVQTSLSLRHSGLPLLSDLVWCNLISSLLFSWLGIAYHCARIMLGDASQCMLVRLDFQFTQLDALERKALWARSTRLLRMTRLLFEACLRSMIPPK